jgi:DNA-binding transcriptional ArsR family regulator
MLNHMVEQTSLDDVFHALANDARRRMLDRLAERDLTVGALAEPLSMSLAGASKHVKVLERAGLVERTVVGREHHCRLRADELESATAWLRRHERYWTARLDRLQDVLEEDA